MTTKLPFDRKYIRTVMLALEILCLYRKRLTCYEESMERREVVSILQGWLQADYADAFVWTRELMAFEFIIDTNPKNLILKIQQTRVAESILFWYDFSKQDEDAVTMQVQRPFSEELPKQQVNLRKLEFVDE